MNFLGIHAVFFTITIAATESWEHPTTCSFEKLVDSKLFLDKTMFIEKFLTSKQKQLIMTGPRNFGKSSLLDTLRRFLEIEISDNGTRIEKTQFKRLFEKTNIFKTNKDFFTHHFAQYPVLCFDFTEIGYENFDDFARTFVRMINKEFARHRYLLKSKALSADDEKIFNNFTTSLPWGKPNVTDVPNPWAYMLAGRELSILLEKFFGRRPVLLVDNYDAFKTAIVGPNILRSNYELENILEVLGLFLGALATDNFAQRSLLTGVTRFGTVYRDYASNLQLMTIFDDVTLSPYWGISLRELSMLAGKSDRLAEIDLVKKAFCGYHINRTADQMFGPASRMLGTASEMCSMSSVFHFMETGKIEPDPETRLELKNMEKLLKYGQYGSYVDNALKNGAKVKFLSKITNYHLLKFRDTMMTSGLLQDHVGERVNFFFQFLTENGYFTVKSKDGENEKGFVGEIIVPNEKIQEDLQHAVYVDKLLQDKERGSSYPTTAEPKTTKTSKKR